MTFNENILLGWLLVLQVFWFHSCVDLECCTFLESKRFFKNSYNRKFTGGSVDSNGYDSMLLLPRAGVQSLVGEIKYHKLQSMAKKLSFLIKKKKYSYWSRPIWTAWLSCESELSLLTEPWLGKPSSQAHKWGPWADASVEQSPWRSREIEGAYLKFSQEEEAWGWVEPA